MPTIARKFSPDTIQDNGPVPQQIQRIRLCLRELYRIIGSEGLGSTGGSSSGSGGAPGAPGTPGLNADSLAMVSWHGNGPYRVDTAVDGAWVVTRDCTITQIYLWRGTAGTSGQTVMDVMFNRAGAGAESLYTTAANRPTLAFDDADDETHANLPDIVDLIVGDVITVNCIEKDAGRPSDFALTLEAVAT